MLFIQLFCFGQSKLEGSYLNKFGERLVFENDSIFSHTWQFDLASSWTKGTYRISNDTIYLRTTLIYDTLEIVNSENEFIKDSLVVSIDETSNSIRNEEFVMSLVAGGGQNRLPPPDKLVLVRGKLFRLNKLGIIDKSKKKQTLTDKSFKTYFFKRN